MSAEGRGLGSGRRQGRWGLTCAYQPRFRFGNSGRRRMRKRSEPRAVVLRRLGCTGAGDLAAASVAGSEAGGGVREDVRLPDASRTIAAGTPEGGRRSFAWARA